MRSGILRQFHEYPHYTSCKKENTVQYIKYLYGNRISLVTMELLIKQLTELNTLQLDPFPCSCSLLPLARWAESRKAVGMACILDGRLRNVVALTKLCHIKEERMPSGQNKVQSNTSYCNANDENNETIVNLFKKENKNKINKEREELEESIVNKDKDSLISEINYLLAAVTEMKLEIQSLRKRVQTLEEQANKNK
uniref:Uncharacterized protein n=1 Tax=Amphimedon queenslandica TaxID=400682 RepID=A0A1X7UUZ6_AMPQE